MLAFSFKNYCRALMAAIVTLVSALLAPAASAQDWVGSTGTVDPNSTNLVKYINGRVELRSGRRHRVYPIQRAPGPRSGPGLE